MKKFALVLLVITVCLFTPIAVNATTTTEMYGFEYSTDGFIAIEDNWNTYLSMPVIDINNYTLGVVTTFTGRYQVDPNLLEIDNGMFVTMVKVIMTPYKYPSNNVYGYSDDLIIESDVDDYPTSKGNELANYSPVATATSTTYNIGFSAGKNTSISATGEFRATDLNIYNRSNTPQQHYGTEYDYNIRTGVWCVKTYFTTETSQFSLFVVETPEGEDFNNELVIYARFAAATSSNYFTCVSNNLNYAVDWAYYDY